MMPPGFGPEHPRSSDGGSHGLAALRFPYGEVVRMKVMEPGIHSEYYNRHGPRPQLENGNGRPRMMMAAGSMGMSSPVRSASAEVWDIKALAAHRHRTLVAESSAQRMELEARMHAIPPQACPPGFRTPPLHSEPPPPPACPPGFRPQSIYNEAPPPQSCPPGFRPTSIYNEAPLTQSCPPGFRPPILYQENSAIMQPEMKFRNAEPNTYRPEFYRDDRPGDPIGLRDTMRVSSIYGSTDRRGWYPNESSSSAARVCENRNLDPQVSKPSTLLPQPRAEQIPNQSRGANLENENRRREKIPNQSRGANFENENWRREVLPQHVRPHSPSVPVSNITTPASYSEAVWTGNLGDEAFASNREAGKRRSYEGADNPPLTSPFKRPRADYVDSFLGIRSRRNPEFERSWSDGSRMNFERSHDRDGSHPSSLHPRKQTEYRSMPESGERSVEHWRDRQELRTRRNSPRSLPGRGSQSPRDRNRRHHSIEISQESELRTRLSPSRPMSYPDRLSLRALPRPYRSNSKEKQPRNDSYVDKQSGRSNHGIWSPRLSLSSWSPDDHPNYDRRSLRVDESSMRRDRSPRLLAGKSSCAAETDQHAAHWRSGNMLGGVERQAARNGSSTIIHSSRALGEHVKDERCRSGAQIFDLVAEHQSQSRCSNVIQKATDTLDIAPTWTDKIKIEKALSPPLRASNKRKLSEVEIETGQRGKLEKKLLLHKNNDRFSDLRASSSSAKYMTSTGENQLVAIQPVPAKSLKSARNLANPKSASVPNYHTLQALEVDWKISPEKVTPRRRRTVGAAADPPVAKISGADEAAAMSPNAREANIIKVSSPKPGQNLDELQGGILHPGKNSKSLLGSRSLLERRSLAASERNGQISDIGIIEVGIVKPFVDQSRLSSDHSPSLVLRTDSHVTAVCEVDTCFNERTGQKVIFTGHRSEHIRSAKSQKIASGSDFQFPESLGKSHTPSGSLLQEDVLGFLSSQQTKEVLPTSTVSKGRGSSHTGLKRPPDDPFAVKADLSSPDKDRENFTLGNIKFDLASFKASETRAQKLTSLEKESSLEGSPVNRQNLERVQLANSGSESELISPSNCVEDKSVNPSVRYPAPFLDELVGRDVLPPGTSSNASIASASETIEVFQLNGSTAESFHVSVESELQHSSASGGDKQAEQPDVLASSKGISVLGLAKVMMEKGEADVVQGKQDMKMVSQPSDSLNISATEGDKLPRQLGTVVSEQTESVGKLDMVLTDTGAAVVTGGIDVMNIVSQPSDLQDSTASTGNNRVEQLGIITKGDADSVRTLDRILTGERDAAVTERTEDPNLITRSSDEVVQTVLQIDLKPGKRHLEKGGKFEQVLTSQDVTADVKKSSTVAESSGIAEGIMKDFILVKNQMPSLKVGVKSVVPFLKAVNTPPLSSLPLAQPVLKPQFSGLRLGMVGRSYRSNKTWRREAMAVSPKKIPNNPGPRPAVVTQPSAYVRKKFSIVRFPAPPVPLRSNLGTQPTALSKFPQTSATESVNKSPASSALKLLKHPQVGIISPKAAAAAAASLNTKILDTKMSDLNAMPSEKPMSSPIRGSILVGQHTLATPSEFIESDMLAVSESKISPPRPSHFEASSDLTSLAGSPTSKPPARATDEAFGYVVSGTRLFMQRKSNQGVVGLTSASASPISRPGLEKCDVPLGYVKRKTNQLVRCSQLHETRANDALQNVFGEVGDQTKSLNKQRRYSTQLKTKTKLGRVLCQNYGRIPGLARVWTLSNEGKHTTSALGVSRDRRYPLFPWKRVNTVAPRLRRGRSLHEGKMGALFFHISNQLQKYRSGHPVYTRSADGFSLHRSGVVSRSGANLKWTKSLMTQSILASEAATKVVAEAEKKKRVKKEAVVMAVVKARDQRRALQDSAKEAKLRSGPVDPSSVSPAEPVGNGGAVYVRKGFGNQLVRDARTTARAFASEKVRWSLHNARLRRAKKQAFCVYYTRFGVCKRGDGKCLYIHDPEKVAVCTKFLRGSCSDSVCCLTHKVIPERMSDCSYFLEGLCTNENCPYRHVNVNPKAPICEGFLQGYCADGDKCNKKHTYVCPQYTVTGNCSSSTCKLRHPKKTKQPTSASKDNIGSKREGRYFAPTAPAEGEYQRQYVGEKIAESGDERVDFISVDEIDSESSKECQDTDKFLDHRDVVLLSRLPKGGSTNTLESLLKPRFLLKRDVTSS